MSPEVRLSIANLEKTYGALRPLRIQALDVEAGSLVAVMGIDAPGAEMFTNLATGAVLPDRGEVRLFGASTAAVTTPEDWLGLLDRVGIVTDRAVLLDSYTVAQNLAMPRTLDLDPLSSELFDEAGRLAREVGLPAHSVTRQVSSLTPIDKLRVRFGRALALQPVLLLMEHPTASLGPGDSAAFAADVRRIIEARFLAAVAITADRSFAEAATPDVRELRPADGALLPRAAMWGRVRRFLRR
jgi:ABC-type transporter Mla maintaining outer membrane lipid asymmetry ATPase subunit MlaF